MISQPMTLHAMNGIYIYVCPTVHNAVPRPQQKINHCTLLNVPVLHWHSIDSIILKKNNFHGTLETTCWKRAIDITMLKMFTLNPESFWNLIPVVIYRYMHGNLFMTKILKNTSSFHDFKWKDQI